VSFRRRLIVTTSTLTLGTLAFALTCVYWGVNRVQESILDRALLGSADEEARLESGMPEDRLTITDAAGPTANSAAPLPKYAIVFARDGNVHESTANARGGPGLSMLPLLSARRHALGQPFDVSYGKVKLRAVLVPVPQHVGWKLFLAVPRADVDRDDWLIGGSMLVAFVLSLFIAIAVIRWVMGRLTRGHLAIANTALRVAEGDLSARVGIQQGDAEIVSLSKNFDRMVERLQRIVEAQHHFVAHAAHEIRSPLTTIYGSLALALRQPRQADEYRRLIHDAVDSAKHLNRLAEDLLLLARVQAAEADDGTEPVLVADFVYDAVKSVQGTATQRGVQIHVREGTASVTGRPRDLERMVRNLVENAVRYSPRDDAVLVDASWVGREARITIEDHGPGVPDGARERIFQPFVRGDDAHARPEGGAGLGLAIAREIARHHGGNIWLDGATKGARFVIALPARPPPRSRECTRPDAVLIAQ